MKKLSMFSRRVVNFRVVSCLVPLCEWSREHDYESLHLYCLATLYLLSQVLSSTHSVCVVRQHLGLPWRTGVVWLHGQGATRRVRELDPLRGEPGG